MAYTGDVTPGGPADVRELPALTIAKASVGPMDNNAYLLTCRATGEQLLIDAAADHRRLLDLIGPAGLRTVVTTHRHADHTGALRQVVTATGARSLAHADDAAAIPPGPPHPGGGGRRGAPARGARPLAPADDAAPTPLATAPLQDGDPGPVGDCALEVTPLVGHPPGSIALLYRAPAGPPHLF